MSVQMSPHTEYCVGFACLCVCVTAVAVATGCAFGTVDSVTIRAFCFHSDKRNLSRCASQSIAAVDHDFNDIYSSSISVVCRSAKAEIILSYASSVLLCDEFWAYARLTFRAVVYGFHS